MPDPSNPADFCEECRCLLTEYLSAAREARVSLEAVSSAREAGLLDELGSFAADAQLENSLSHLSRTQQAYARHWQESHTE